MPPSGASPTDDTLAAYQAGVDAYVAGTPPTVFAPTAHLLDELAALVPGGHVLEVGSGPGREAQHLEDRGLRVQRTDAAPAFVERLRQAGLDARLLDVRSDDLGGSYDAVLANAVLLHLSRDDLGRAVRRCRAAVRPGGLLALTLKQGDGEAWSDATLDRPRCVYWRASALHRVLEDGGWSVLRLDHASGGAEAWLHVLCRREG